MPKSHFALALLLVAAGAPLVATAASTGCSDAPPQEQTTVYPLKPGVYVHVSQDPGNATQETGFWQETNGREGLQTRACVSGQETIYRPDRNLGIALP